MENLIGKNVLIVDEVDDTRTTLEYAVRELQKDVEDVSRRLGRESEETMLSVFVLHVSWLVGTEASLTPAKNKDKQKKGKLPDDMMASGRYQAAVTVSDVWICYPWEAEYVTRIAKMQTWH
jgi:hypothetical protein